MSDDHAATIDRHVRIAMIVYVALLGLTAATVGAYYIELPLVGAIVLALFIASIKGSLVCCYFMHLLDEKKLIHWVLALTVFFLIGLLLLPVLTSGWDNTGV
jgi:cytochrome c oxidase subunit 4